jgi:hypothetical protein
MTNSILEINAWTNKSGWQAASLRPRRFSPRQITNSIVLAESL